MSHRPATDRRDPMATRIALAVAALKGIALLGLAWWWLR
jgi:hypothetical protein